MFKKYLFDSKKLNNIKLNAIESFSYTKLIDEPSMLHSHSKCEIIVPLNDYGFLLLYNKKIRLKKDEIIIVNPNVIHTEKNNINTTEKLEYFSIKLNIIVSFDNKEILFLNNKESNEDITWYLEKAYKYLSNNDDEELAILNLSSFYILFMNELNKSGLYPTTTTDTKIPFYIKEAKNFIQLNYSKNISIQDLCKKYNVCQTIFCNKFKQYIGTTPSKYVIKFRIQTAMHLLITTNYSIAQISNLCGFKSPAHFTKTFKNQTNILPKYYRDKN